jgi:hypothetical protein
MDKTKKLSAAYKTHAKTQITPPPQSYSYYLSNSTYIDDKNKVEKHLEIKSNGNTENAHYMEKKNGEIKINLHDMDKIKRYLKKT